MQALHAKKLEQALRSHERFPINLEWMVDVFKYKHISSLTTHLKRHFKMNVHYKRFAQEQNKRVWTYYISVDCFIGICEYVRHAARKKIANLWLRKVGVKGSSRRTVRDFEFAATDEEEEVEQDEEGEFEFEDEEDEEAPQTVRRRKRDDDEEFQLEDDGDESDERAYFREEEEEDDSSLPADSEDEGSLMDYDSSSSSSQFDTPPCRARVASLTISSSGSFSPTSFTRQMSSSIAFPPGSPAHFRSLSSSSLSSGASSPSSSPSSPVLPRAQRIAQARGQPSPFGSSSPSFTARSSAQPLSGSQGISRPQNTATATPPAPIPAPTAPVPIAASNIPGIKQENPDTPTDHYDWGYLLLRPSPPAGAAIADLSNNYLTSLLMGPGLYSRAHQQQAVGGNTYFSAHQSNGFHPHTQFGFTAGKHDDSFGELPGLPSMDDLPFDTNVFLALPPA